MWEGTYFSSHGLENVTRQFSQICCGISTPCGEEGCQGPELGCNSGGVSSKLWLEN